MDEKRLRKVMGRFLLTAPVGDANARAAGFSLNLPERDGVYGDQHVLGDLFTALVDDALYAKIEAQREGMLIPVELPCVFLAKITTREETQQLGVNEGICQAWELGATLGRREYLGHALYTSYDAAARHVAGMDALVGQDPAGERFIFGDIWRVRLDEDVAAQMKDLGGGPLFPTRQPDPSAQSVPFEHWTAHRDPSSDD